MRVVSKEKIALGKNHDIDPTVIVGYLPSREILDYHLSIGSNARIRSGTVIYAGSKIGDNLQTGHNVIIREKNVIGDDFYIWSNSMVDYGCIIGNNVKIHSNVYVAQFTVIEDNVFLAPGVMIANDLHPGCKYSGKCLKGPTIKRGAKIGVNVTLLPRVTIGEHCLVGAGSVVTEDIPPRSVAYGNPAKVRGSIDDLECVTGLTKKPYSGS